MRKRSPGRAAARSRQQATNSSIPLSGRSWPKVTISGGAVGAQRRDGMLEGICTMPIRPAAQGSQRRTASRSSSDVVRMRAARAASTHSAARRSGLIRLNSCSSTTKGAMRCSSPKPTGPRLRLKASVG